MDALGKRWTGFFFNAFFAKYHNDNVTESMTYPFIFIFFWAEQQEINKKVRHFSRGHKKEPSNEGCRTKNLSNPAFLFPTYKWVSMLIHTEPAFSLVPVFFSTTSTFGLRAPYRPVSCREIWQIFLHFRCLSLHSFHPLPRSCTRLTRFISMEVW